MQSTDMAQEILKRADSIGLWLSGAIEKTADVAQAQAIDIALAKFQQNFRVL